MFTRRTFLPLIAGGSLLLAAATAPAALVAHDGFESYALAGLNGDNGGTGWQTAWVAQATGANVVAGGLSYNAGSIQINGGNQAVSVTVNSDALLVRQFPTLASTGTTTADVSTTEVWFSFLFQQVSGTGSDFLNFWVGDHSNRNFSGSIGDQSTTNAEFSARNRAFDDVNASQSVAYTNAQTYLLVGRISRDGTTGEAVSPLRFDQTELWVNPTSTTLGTPDAVVDASLGMDGLFAYFGLRTFNVGSGDDYRFDELRIGTDATSVLAVPEPASLALLGLGTLTMLRHRKRRV